jgi:hypothetical protein
MLITKCSTLTGKIHQCEINVTEEQLTAWQSGMLIQVAMPQVSSDDREFIITGSTSEEWDEIFGGS